MDRIHDFMHIMQGKPLWQLYFRNHTEDKGLAQMKTKCESAATALRRAASAPKAVKKPAQEDSAAVVVPLVQEASAPVVVPLAQEASAPVVVPLAQEASAPVVVPLAHDASAPDEVEPLAHEASAPDEVEPSAHEASAPDEVEPSAHEALAPTVEHPTLLSGISAEVGADPPECLFCFSNTYDHEDQAAVLPFCNVCGSRMVYHKKCLACYCANNIREDSQQICPACRGVLEFRHIHGFDDAVCAEFKKHDDNNKRNHDVSGDN